MIERAGAVLPREPLKWTAPVVLLLAAFALRVWQFGNPLIESDEQFYLLVAQRMWEGEWVYSGIWDRKPPGLFLLYALFAKLGDGLYAYQVAATLFAAGTAWVIACIARRWVSDRAAICAGLLYLPALHLTGGDGGQSPVFYNLLMALAGLFVLRVLEGRSVKQGLLWGGAAMLMAGLALQIKYSAVFEGVFFGLVLMAWLWRQRGRFLEVLGAGAGWALIALVPTLVALLIYVATGRSDDFVYANFISIFERDPSPALRQLGRLAKIVVFLLPVWASAVAGLLLVWRRPFPSPAARFCALWLGASALGLLIMGDFYDHYALPLLVPAAINAAALFDAASTRRWLGYGAIAYAVVAGGFVIAADRNEYGRGGGELLPFVAAIGQNPKGCLYVYQGPSALYSLTHSCLVTRYIYPSHLSHVKEQFALGVRQGDELQRIMMHPPGFVLIKAGLDKNNAPRSRAQIESALAQGYKLVHRGPIGRDTFLLYANTVPGPLRISPTH